MITGLASAVLSFYLFLRGGYFFSFFPCFGLLLPFSSFFSLFWFIRASPTRVVSEIANENIGPQAIFYPPTEIVFY
jgi:hypothetical protein